MSQPSPEQSALLPASDAPAPATSSPTPPPESIDRFPGYRVTMIEKRDAHCTCYAARDQRLDRNVTIRELSPHPDRRTEAVERFFAEARATAGLRHPHLERNLDTGRTGETFYLVSERLTGETVQDKLQRLERGTIPEREAVRIIADAARGLQALFGASTSHRRVSPTTLILASDRRVRLLEPGFARELAWPNDREFAVAHPEHASPEQLAGEDDIDIRSDLYALGCTWFHLLLGHPPFRAATPAQVARMHLQADRPVPRELNPRLGAASSQGILWLLERERNERPRTPAQFLDKLMRHPLLQEDGKDAGAKPETNRKSADAPPG